MNNLIIIGAGETAEIACEYFTDSMIPTWNVEGFAVESKYNQPGKILFDKPVRDLETIERWYPPHVGNKLFVAVGYGDMNRDRERLFNNLKERGYTFASYVSPHAFVGRDVHIGENCMVMEHNVLQRKVRLGENVFLWSGNHVGHRSVIEDHCFITSHCVISGFCKVGRRSFLGVNCTLADKVSIGEGCLIAAGSTVVHDTQPGKLYSVPRAKEICKSPESCLNSTCNSERG